MKKKSEEVWYRDGLEFECRQCGRCCGGEPGYIWMSEAEIRKAAKTLNLHVLDFCQMYLAEHPEGFSLRELENGDCCLLRGGKCSIYKARPIQCRTWPFWPSNLKTLASWREAGRRCPGIGQGCHWSLARIAVERKKMDV